MVVHGVKMRRSLTSKQRVKRFWIRPLILVFDFSWDFFQQCRTPWLILSQVGPFKSGSPSSQPQTRLKPSQYGSSQGPAHHSFVAKAIADTKIDSWPAYFVTLVAPGWSGFIGALCEVGWCLRTSVAHLPRVQGVEIWRRGLSSEALCTQHLCLLCVDK